MRCISRKFIPFFLIIVLISGILGGCGQDIELELPYEPLGALAEFNDGILGDQYGTQGSGNVLVPFAADLSVVGTEPVEADIVSAEPAQGAALFCVESNETLFSRNAHERLYPASTTKILTAYIALKYGDLTEIATVSQTSLELEEGSSVCGLAVGDQISLEQLLYGLMLCSGNDAANVIAELISGSIEGFAELMNQEALALGATNSHFVNPHGLTDEQHYTTVYDLYLIFQEAVKVPGFRSLIESEDYNAKYLNSQGETVARTWSNTNRYLTGEQLAPEGVTVLGGKTGTTEAAGSCLVLYSEDSQGVHYISIVLKAAGRENLYLEMNELLDLEMR